MRYRLNTTILCGVGMVGEASLLPSEPLDERYCLIEHLTSLHPAIHPGLDSRRAIYAKHDERREDLVARIGISIRRSIGTGARQNPMPPLLGGVANVFRKCQR